MKEDLVYYEKQCEKLNSKNLKLKKKKGSKKKEKEYEQIIEAVT